MLLVCFLLGPRAENRVARAAVHHCETAPLAVAAEQDLLLS